MDSNGQITEDNRNYIYKQLFDTTLNLVENGQLPFNEMQNVSQFVLNNLDFLKTSADLDSFLDNLNLSWPVFNSTVLAIKDTLSKSEDMKNIEEKRGEIASLAT